MTTTAFSLPVPQSRSEGTFRRAELRLAGVANTGFVPISLRVYLSEPNADELTPFPDHPRFVGRDSIPSRTGPNSLTAGAGFADAPTELRYDVTAQLRGVLAEGQTPIAHLVITDTLNRRLHSSRLAVAGAELRFYD